MIKTMKLGMFVCALLGGFAATGCVAEEEDPEALAEAVEAATIESGIPDTTALEAGGPDYHGCPAGKFCLWEHPNFQGRMAYSQYAHPDLHEMNNRASSLVNRIPAEICVYARTNYGGSRAILIPHEAVMPKLSAAINDEIESFKSCR